MRNRYGFYIDEYSDGTSVPTLGVGDGKSQFTSVVFSSGEAALGISYGRGIWPDTTEEFPEGTTAEDAGVQCMIKFESHAGVNAVIGALYEVKKSLGVEDIDSSQLDNFIAYGTDTDDEPHEVYARWVLHYYRLPANLIISAEKLMGPHKLFCMYKGVKHKVTGAGTIGDIWITPNLTQEHGYRDRVSLDELSNWSKE
tara:strand:+ start:878 stop:1471 length:594 start_codon:yes stop_codon:yes gene_type:complete